MHSIFRSWSLFFKIFCFIIFFIPALQSQEPALEDQEPYPKSTFAQKWQQFWGNDSRNFYYTLNTDIGFLLGFNGQQMVENGRKKVFIIEPVVQRGDLLRYGFSGTVNFGLVWPMNPIAEKRSRIPYKLRSPEAEIPYKWSLGFQVRNMISVGQTSFIFNNTINAPYKYYNQQDLRAFYAFQPVFYISWVIFPLWELGFHVGPSFNWNFYQKTNEIFSWELGDIKQVKKTVRTEDSKWLSTFSLGAVMGVSFAHYFYSFLSAGISTQFVLNLSPYNGDYSLGQFVFGLYVQFIF